MYTEQLKELRRLRLLRVRNLLMEGLSYEEIAVQVGIAHRTVKHYIAELCALYGVQRCRSKFNSVQLAVAVYNAGHCNCAVCRGERGYLAGLPEPSTAVPGSDIPAVAACHGNANQQLHKEVQHPVSTDLQVSAASTLLQRSKAKL